MFTQIFPHQLQNIFDGILFLALFYFFQVITPFRSLVLCCESRREMEEWLGALTAASQRRYNEPDQPDCLSGQHHW